MAKKKTIDFVNIYILNELVYINSDHLIKLTSSVNYVFAHVKLKPYN